MLEVHTGFRLFSVSAVKMSYFCNYFPAYFMTSPSIAFYNVT